MTTLVTGANGFLGSNLVRELLENGERVVATDTVFSNPHLPSCEQRITDILCPESLEEIFSGITEVYHCAGLVSYNTRSDQERLFAVNYEGTRNVLRAATHAGVEKAVYVSSTAAMGTSPLHIEGKRKEQSVLQGCSLDFPYMVSKALGENVAFDFSRNGLPLTIVNPSTILGAGDFNKKSQSAAIDFLAQRNPTFVFPRRLSTVDVQDVAKGAILAMKKGGEGEKYILCNENITVKKYVRLTNEALERRKHLVELPLWTYYPLAYGLNIRDLFFSRFREDTLHNADLLFILYRDRTFDATKAKAMGWQPTVSTKTSFERAVEFYRKN